MSNLTMTATSSPSSATAFALTGVEKWFETTEGRVLALSRTDLEITAGNLVVVLGPSGCGKTTLLRLIAGLDFPSRGNIQIANRELWRNRRRQKAAAAGLGVVFQDAHLFPWLNIERNITLPLELGGVAPVRRAERARQLLALVGIAGFEKAWPRELSGGMRQRAAIARALSSEPAILLMDEPFGALDAMTRDVMNLELQRIWLETRKTILIVTHSIAEAVFLGDRVILMSPRPGRVDTVVDVNFPRPRALDLQGDAGFQNIVIQLRRRLGEMS